MGIGCLEHQLGRLFSAHSLLLLRHPWPFVLLPCLLTAFLCIGLFELPRAWVKDELELYTPDNALARRELRELDELFHINDSDPFYASRRYDLKRSGYILITADADQQEEGILSPKKLKAAAQLWSMVQSLGVGHGQGQPSIAYPSLCVQFPLPHSFRVLLLESSSKGRATEEDQQKGEETEEESFCVSNPLLELVKLALDQRSADQLWQSLAPLKNDSLSIGQLLGSVSFDQLGSGVRGLLGGISLDPETRRIAGAKALMLPYALRHSSQAEEALAEKWELKLADFLLSFRSPLIQADWWTYETLAAESGRDRAQLQRMLLPCFVAVSLFSVLLCCSRSPVHSRPLLALGGLLSVVMAILSSLGLLLLLGFRFNSVVLSMPFVVFSIGVDNCFLLLAAWRTTPSHLGLEKRMQTTFGEAGVSVTITWITDLLSFAIGCLTPFPSVQMFCLASAIALFFTFVYQLTLFGALFGWSNRREVQNRHWLTLRRLRLSPEEKGNGLLLARFFRGPYASLLLHPLVRAVVVLCFGFYLMLSAYGCLNIQLGLEPYDLLPENSYGKRALRLAENYFPDYGSVLHVWMRNLSQVHLGHRRLWLILEKEIELYEHTEFTGPADNWLRSFLHFQWAQGVQTTDENFVPRLKSFLKLGQHRKYKRDVRFTEDGRKLDASRVPVRLRSVGFQNQSRAMSLFRKLAESSELPTRVYADFFLFAEQYNSIVPATISSIGIAGLAVILVSLLFIPELSIHSRHAPLAALWVSFATVSINLGILGLLPLLSLRLDFVSMVTIVMSIGFSVDFCAHLAHSFARAKGESPNQKMRIALFTVGTPIVQSASSTILGTSFLAATDSYIFRSFFKTILLVIGLGVLHGLVFLPVLLTLFQQGEEELRTSEKQLSARNISAPMPMPTMFGGISGFQQQSIFLLPNPLELSIRHLKKDGGLENFPCPLTTTNRRERDQLGKSQAKKSLAVNKNIN